MTSRFFHLVLFFNFYFSVLFFIYPKFPHDVQDRALVISSIYRPRPILSSVDICNETVLCSTIAHNIGVIVDQSHATSCKRSAFAMVQPRKQPLRESKALELEKRRHCVTHWLEQRGVDFFVQRQICQSDCDISSNCGKKVQCCNKYKETMHFCVTPHLHYAQCIAFGILTKKQLKTTCPILQFNSYVSGQGETYRHCSYQVLIEA